ncbi:MAG TPA: 8-amino-7-oxononanoate synthase [Thermodesulfobacteriota bacterium]
MIDSIREELARLDTLGLKRSFKVIEGPQGPVVKLDGREVILMCSNDYLGFANNPLVKKAAIVATEKWGTGAGASRLVSGTMEAHVMLEERIRRFKGAEAVLLFNSGYNANLALLSTLADRTTEVFSDRLNHASIVDACVLCRAKVKRYSNRDCNALEGLLKASKAKRRIIITDSVFSMDGTLAPLAEISGLAQRYGAALIVDDAHATGVLGNGRGSLEHFGVKDPDIIQMGTLGKALGSFGAFVAARREVIELLVSKARPFIYTTALPPTVCAAAAKAVDLIEEDPSIIKRLWENTGRLKERLTQAGLDTMESATPIVPVLAGDAKRVMEISERLLERGVFIQGIRPPTVPYGTARLRATLSSAHSIDEVDRAAAAIIEAFDVQ